MIIYFYKLLPLLLITNFCCSNEKLNSLSLEQKKHTVSIISAIHKISYESNIELIFPDKSSKYFKIPYLLKELKDFKIITEKDNVIADYINTLPKLKMKEAKGIELFMFSHNGYKSIKFTSNGIKLGKMKIGPFEIPSNKILIASPKIFYY